VSDAYRAATHTCPACSALLREHVGRLCCDRCEGIFLAREDLARSIDDLVKLEPELVFRKEKPGKRACPRCAIAMVRCRLELRLLDKRIRPKVDLDRCDADGLWFDRDQLAALYLAVERVFGAHGGGGNPQTGPLGTYGKFNLPP
jgi:Zn-finger nucleic acid-binding protein